jgi:predicted nucleic acid-binding Zn ribbon protein
MLRAEFQICNTWSEVRVPRNLTQEKPMEIKRIGLRSGQVFPAAWAWNRVIAE